MLERCYESRKQRIKQNGRLWNSRVSRVLGLIAATITLSALTGCSGLVGSTSSLPSLDITNVQAISATTSAIQIAWTTNVPSDSAVDYGTTTAYGTSTQVNSALVTSHQVTLTALAPATTYYFQVDSTDARNNHGYSGGHAFKTAGYTISGTISPALDGSGATMALTGAASATVTADSSGNYVFTGLPNGTYKVTPSRAGYTFSPSSSNAAVNGANVTAINFSASAAAGAPTITTQPANQTVTAGQTASFTVVATGTAPLNYQWQKNGANIGGATSASYTTPQTTTADSGSTFQVVVSNTAGTVTSAPATLTVNAAPAPGIQVSPTSINFGNVVVGSSTSQALIVTNTGTATLNITQVTPTGTGFTASGFTLPLNVGAGQQTTITVVYQPIAVGSATGNISITSNASTPPTSVGLSGTGITATFILGVTPASLSFGNVTTGTTSPSQSVTVVNSGNSNVTITQVTASGAGFSMGSVAVPVTLSPSQNLTVTATFSPTVTGNASGSISIVSNATGSPASVSLSGSGVAPLQHSAALTWNASTSTVAGYNEYRGTVSGGPYSKINSALVTVLNYTDTTVVSGTTYYYVVTAVDSSGTESVYSNEVSAPIP